METRLPIPLLILCMTAAAFAATPPSDTAGTAPAHGYTGSQVCRACHQAEFDAWRGSDHDRAMEEATEASVLGRFDGSTFTHGETKARFFRRDGAFYIHTAGPDGKYADFKVEYTFGAEPLQQYLIRLPGGRLQSTVVAWDSRSKSKGGQRWFRLQPDETIPPGDILHWTGPAQNWNSMCADCHSTGLRRNYHPETRTYETSWSEIDVACEACHGPGSQHVAWAEAEKENRPVTPNSGLTVDLSEDGAAWLMQASTGIAKRSGARRSKTQLETCAPCHSRRTQIGPDPKIGAPYLDSYLPALLDQGLYFADGQMRDEVYVYGSFVQSKMHAAGVTCSDCHEPHSLELRGTVEAVCAQCHAPAKFATTAHHGHSPMTMGSRCVDCHMPATTYMEIDARRDHSFRIPRPDLSPSLGTPNACNGCHQDETTDWATAKISRWRGTEVAEQPHWAQALAGTRAGDRSALPALLAIIDDNATPGIIRATAMVALAQAGAPTSPVTIAKGAGDRDPLIRLAAAQAIEALPADQVPDAAWNLLDDPRRAVRIEAGYGLAPALRGKLPDGRRRALEKAIGEYRAAQQINSDRPMAWTNLGLLDATLGRPAEAETAYKKAIAVGSYYIPAHVNLADLYRALGRDIDAEKVLSEALREHAGSADLHHARGLTLVRLKRLTEALVELETAARLAPESVRYAYVYGVALNSTGNGAEAITVLKNALARHPHDGTLREALAAFYRDARQPGKAAK